MLIMNTTIDLHSVWTMQFAVFHNRQCCNDSSHIVHTAGGNIGTSKHVLTARHIANAALTGHETYSLVFVCLLLTLHLFILIIFSLFILFCCLGYRVHFVLILTCTHTHAYRNRRLHADIPQNPHSDSHTLHLCAERGDSVMASKQQPRMTSRDP